MALTKETERKYQTLVDTDGTEYPLPERVPKRDFPCQEAECFLEIKDLDTGDVYDLRKQKGRRTIIQDAIHGDTAYFFVYGENILGFAVKRKKGITIAGEDMDHDPLPIGSEYEFSMINVGSRRLRLLPDCSKHKSYSN